jgi:hypothetical protein
VARHNSKVAWEEEWTRNALCAASLRDSCLHLHLACFPYCEEMKLRLTASLVQWPKIQRSGVGFQALPDYLRSNRSGTGSTQPRKYN